MSKEEKKLGVVKDQIKNEVKECSNLISKKDPMFVGLDPSYDGFGIIVLDKDANIIVQNLVKTDSKKEIEERIIDLEKQFEFIANIISLNRIYIEGLSHQSTGNFVLQMGGLHYYLRVFFYKKCCDYKIVPPGELKKFITGKGNAKKNLMLLNVFKKFGVSFEDDNLADAYSLARLALEDYKNETK